LAAIAASLLCKEVGALSLLLLPWLPAGTGWTRRTRWRVTAMAAAVTLAWGLAYWALASRGAVGLGYHSGAEGATLLPPLWTRAFWAFDHSARSAFSLQPEHGAWDAVTAGLLGVLLATAGAVVATRRDARAR